MLSEEIQLRLLERAKAATNNSYSPYSGYSFGAAVLTNSGEIFLGTSVENASYGLSICAERAAICNAVSNGYQSFSAIAIYSKDGDPSPCGSCRQFILEFGKDILLIALTDGNLSATPISTLLPGCFPIKKTSYNIEEFD